MASQQLVQRILCARARLDLQRWKPRNEEGTRVGTGQISNISCFLPLSQLAVRVDPARATHSSRSLLRERPPSPSQAHRPSFCKGNPHHDKAEYFAVEPPRSSQTGVSSVTILTRPKS